MGDGLSKAYSAKRFLGSVLGFHVESSAHAHRKCRKHSVASSLYGAVNVTTLKYLFTVSDATV